MKRGRRSVIYGANAFIFTVVILGIIAAVNYVAFKRGEGVRLDVTRGKIHSLSNQTVRVLGSLQDKIEILAFFKQVGVDRREFQDLAQQYENKSQMLEVKFIDPDKEPGISRKYGVSEYGTVVLLKGDRTARLNLSDLISGGIVEDCEEQLTNALIRLSSDIRKTVHFLGGHGERDIGDKTKPEGFGLLAAALRDEAYQVKELLLLRDAKIPPKDSVLIIAGAKKPLADREIEIIKKYIRDGGKAVFMIEPRSSEDLAVLLKRYGIGFGDDVVIDPSSKLVGGGDITPIVADYAPHDISDGFHFATIYPYTRSLEALSAGEGIRAAVVAATSEYSWAERDFTLFEQGIAQNDPTDKAGPLGVFAVSEVGRGARIAAFGSVDFGSNRFFTFSGNGDFFLNAVNWVLGDEHLISIRPKSAGGATLSMTESQMKLIFTFTLVVFPALALFFGTVRWWKRKNM
ncbi:MAG: GldG family protein [Deltaproteobacteria bacterium]